MKTSTILLAAVGTGIAGTAGYLLYKKYFANTVNPFPSINTNNLVVTPVQKGVPQHTPEEDALVNKILNAVNPVTPVIDVVSSLTTLLTKGPTTSMISSTSTKTAMPSMITTVASPVATVPSGNRLNGLLLN